MLDTNMYVTTINWQHRSTVKIREIAKPHEVDVTINYEITDAISGT